MKCIDKILRIIIIIFMIHSVISIPVYNTTINNQELIFISYRVGDSTLMHFKQYDMSWLLKFVEYL